MTAGKGSEGHDIGVAATRFQRAMRNNVTQALGDFRLTGTEYGALDYLSRHTETSNSDLARFLLVSPQSLGKLTACLDQRGLLVRESAPGAHRYRLTLTPDGVTTLAATRPHVEAAQQRLLDPLTPEERAQFARALTLCADHHDNGKNAQP